MKVDYAPRALEALDESPATVRRAFFKQVKLLSYNLRHPRRPNENGSGYYRGQLLGRVTQPRSARVSLASRGSNRAIRSGIHGSG